MPPPDRRGDAFDTSDPAGPRRPPAAGRTSTWTLRAENHNTAEDLRIGPTRPGSATWAGTPGSTAAFGDDGLIADHPDLALRTAAAAA